jgi:polyisoprenoid-binding protein YceI
MSKRCIPDRRPVEHLAQEHAVHAIDRHRPTAVLALACGVLAALAGVTASAAPVTYKIDPDHTYPSFEADHMGGLSVWRGKFNTSRGTVILDRAAQSGSVDVTVDVASADFGQDKLSAYAQGPELFDIRQWPEAHYTGRLAGFEHGAPTRVDGTLTLHGVSHPLTLAIQSFKCMPHPLYKREVCGADALATFQRDAYGMPAGKGYGFNMAVTLRIQVEAIAEPAVAAR